MVAHGHYHLPRADAGDKRVLWAVLVNVVLTLAQRTWNAFGIARRPLNLAVLHLGPAVGATSTATTAVAYRISVQQEAGQSL